MYKKEETEGGVMKAGDSAKMLGALHCFESVARHLSFTRAANELCLTQSAVSYRIRTLETELGFALFHRFVRRISLTDEGERLFGVLRRSLGEIESEIQAIAAQELRGTLSVICPPSFINFWLLPRIARFYAEYPGIEVHVRCQMNLVDFETDRADMAVYYGGGKHPGLHVSLLMRETLFPVCSPAYAAACKLRDKPQALEDCCLLHDSQPWADAPTCAEWKSWLDQAGFTGFLFKKGHSFDRNEFALMMAARGVGVAMGRGRLVEAQLASGELVRPFGPVVPAAQSYWLVMPQDRLHNVRVAAFCTWIEREARQRSAENGEAEH